MKKNIIFVLTIVSLLFIACEKEQLESPICEHPVAIEEFEINFVEQFLFNTPIAVDIDENFRLSYTLFDEGLIVFHELYMLINDDVDKRVRIFGPENDLNTNEKGYSFTMPNLEKFTLDNQEVYNTDVGDSLHFYLTTIDDSSNIVERVFVLSLEL